MGLNSSLDTTEERNRGLENKKYPDQSMKRNKKIGNINKRERGKQDTEEKSNVYVITVSECRECYKRIFGDKRWEFSETYERFQTIDSINLKNMKHDKNKENHFRAHQRKITGEKKKTKTKIIKAARA